MMFDRLAHQFGNEIADLFMVPLYLLKMTQLYYSSDNPTRKPPPLQVAG